ncbi:MAG: hypothetical protein Q3980_04440 [Turicibacter sp.]|nr:hypothetical protein [Turicibacter sp.]
MLEFFQTCCLMSALWVILTLIFGELLDGIGDFDLNGLTLGINLSSRSFLFGTTLFGSCGWTLTEQTSLPMFVIFFISLVVGLCGICFFEQCILRSLKKLQSTSSVSEQDLIGLEAKLIESTSIKKFGKVRLVVNGNMLEFATKGISEDIIPKGTIVTVLKIEKGLMIVGKK